MKIAIHHTGSDTFSERWVAYCQAKKINYKIVNCYSNDIIEQLNDCYGLMWHHNPTNPKDILFAKELLFSLEQAGKKVFPDFNTNWHFDDKLGQKYLLESIEADLVPTYVFYTKEDALKWINETQFPKIFKLRGGSGSENVRLVNNRASASALVNKAFGRGFSQFDTIATLKERWRKYKLKKSNTFDLLKGIVRLVFVPKFSKILGKQRGYIYFQDFIPDNNSDTRIIVIGERAIGIKRMVRENDFRASGSGNIKYEKEEFDERCVKISFEVTEKLKAQCIAFDYIFDHRNIPLIVEISYGFNAKGYDPCTGYWDRNLNWHTNEINPYGWMVDSILE